MDVNELSKKKERESVDLIFPDKKDNNKKPRTAVHLVAWRRQAEGFSVAQTDPLVHPALSDSHCVTHSLSPRED